MDSVNKAKRIKRRAVGKIVWQTVGFMEHALMQLGEILRIESGTPVHRNNPLRGALTEREFNLISQRIKRIRLYLEDFRKIAKHIERGTDDEG